MTKNALPTRRLFTRREMLVLGLGAAAGLAPGAARAAAGPVRTRKIPRSGEALPIVGLGTAIIFDFDSAADAERRAERLAVIRTLLEGGGRVIDTAPSYGAAEDTLGDLLSEPGVHGRPFLATKCRVAAPERASAEMRQSQKRLRTPKFDLMQIHNVGFADPAVVAAQLALLREWRGQGVFRYIGVTHSQRQSQANERLIELMRREKLDFIQVNYSMAERSVEEKLLPVAADTGTAVLVNLPFARARLFSAVRGRPLPEWAKTELDAASWAQFFLKYILGSEAVNCVLPGTDKREYMVDNLAAGTTRLPDAALRRKMVALVESLS
jgi:aryl-alcohol dehydrogenase-like predicted oxidoreductase